MSGGVDSSVAAALLIERGYDVIGITMRLFDIDDESASCNSNSTVNDAINVANQLGIKHYTIDFCEIFKKEIIDYFINEYSSGRTPNPCVKCNTLIKFDALLQKAVDLGADYIATGHYARVKYNEQRNRWSLLRGIDTTKDQSYALYNLTQSQLERIIMPLGELSKNDTRIIAEKYGLTVAGKHDSQDICFIPNKDYQAFIKKHATDSIKPGDILNTEGKVLGKHKGIVFYTIGQRKNIGVSFEKPVYVIKIDPNTNSITIGNNDDLLSNTAYASNFNWLSVNKITKSIDITAKIRYNMNDVSAQLNVIDSSKVIVRFEKAQRAVTPGQSLVCYNGDEVIGGGIITSNTNIES